MPLLHIEVEQLRASAWRLSRMAEEISWQAQRLDHARQSLQANWQGNSQAQFQAEMDARLHTLRRLAQGAADLAVRLQREAARWETIGDRF